MNVSNKKMLASLLVVVTGAFLAAPVCAEQDEAVLVESPQVKISGLDLKARMQRIPEEDHAAVLGSKARIAQLLEGLLVNRTLAQRAREEGLDKTPLFRRDMELVEEGMLTKMWLDKQVKELKLPSFEARAKELYLLNEKQYEIPEQVHASHILVDTKERSKGEALERAKEIRNKLLQGELFEAVADEFSDDPSAKNNKGDLGFFDEKRMVKPFSVAAFAMSKPGEISEPVYTQFGYHIIKFHERKLAKLRPFDEVKDEIIDGLKNAYEKEYRQGLINKIKTDPSIKLHEEEIDKYWVDLDAILKQHEAGAAK